MVMNYWWTAVLVFLYTHMLLKHALKADSRLSQDMDSYSIFNLYTLCQVLLILSIICTLMCSPCQYYEVSALSRLNYYTPSLKEQSSMKGIQLVPTYHTSVNQQRKIV